MPCRFEWGRIVEEGSVIDLLVAKRDASAAACARHGVARLEAFGSAIGDSFCPGESDLDLLVQFEPMDVFRRADEYFNLLDELRGLLDADIGLVIAGAIRNRYISENIERTKQLLYAALRAGLSRRHRGLPPGDRAGGRRC